MYLKRERSIAFLLHEFMIQLRDYAKSSYIWMLKWLFLIKKLRVNVWLLIGESWIIDLAILTVGSTISLFYCLNLPDWNTGHQSTKCYEKGHCVADRRGQDKTRMCQV